MHGVLGALLPLAIAVTIAPIPIIAEILLLFTKRPVGNAAAYPSGFAFGVAAILGLLVVVANAANLTRSGPSRGAAAAQLVLGALLLVACCLLLVACCLLLVACCLLLVAARRRWWSW